MLLASVAKLLLYVGITLVIGDVVLRFRRVFASAGTSPALVQQSVQHAWTTLALGAALLLAAQGRELEFGFDAAAYTSFATDTTWGHGWLLLTASITAGYIAFRRRAATAVQLAFAVLLAYALGGLGHAAADPDWPVVSRVLDALHVLGVGAWLGALYFVARFAPHEHQADAWSAFSRVATLAAPIVVLTGFGSALRRVGASSPSAVLASDYGRLLVVKLILACVVLSFGAMHRQRTVERRLPGASGVRIELAFAALVFLVTSVLTGMAPVPE